ncbi:MAG: HDOD domain-containing protein [Verrucomicrobiales bacterium]|nr:HDOD domain-containing protein [Verrucomicrobiales bacterium]
MKRRSAEDFRQTVLRVEKLYSIPQVLSRALRLVRQPDVSVGQIADLVMNDAALSADFLHLSNSALFRGGEPCTRLTDAIQRLGTKELIRVISLSLSKNVYGKDLANYGITAGQYWTESVWAALFMDALARQANADPSEAYVVGILHQLGRVLINEAILEAGWSLFWDGREAIERWEADHVGFTYAEAGALLLQRWEFPEAIIAPVAHQLTAPTPNGPDNFSNLLRFTRVCLLTADPAHLYRFSRVNVPDTLFRSFGFNNPHEFRESLDDTTARVGDIRRGLAAS